jgi:pimeloyl-ACP methyl ester carboxylesterase
VSVPLPDVPGVTHRFITVRGVRLHLAEAGHPDAEPVLLLHSFPQHWYTWRYVIPLLALHYRVLALDLRGFGWSDAPRHGYSGVSLSDDVVAVLNELGLQRTHVIGHDWGAWVGFITALRHPDRVSHLISVNMTHPWPPFMRLAPNLWRMWHTALMEWPPLGRVVIRRTGFTRFLLRHWVADKQLWDRDELDVFTEVVREPARARAGEQVHAAYVWKEIIAHPFGGRFRTARLTVPTLLLGGDQDMVIPPSVLRGGGRNAENMRSVVVPGCGHLMPEERPVAIANEAVAFFAAPVTPGLTAAS